MHAEPPINLALIWPIKMIKFYFGVLHIRFTTFAPHGESNPSEPSKDLTSRSINYGFTSDINKQSK